MMMNDPENILFQNLLSDYSADVADDGFAQRVQAEIDARLKRQARLRTWLVATATFVGGGIAALNVPALVMMLGDVKLPSFSNPLPLSTSLPSNLPDFNLPPVSDALPLWAYGAMCVFAVCVWVIWDGRGSYTV